MHAEKKTLQRSGKSTPTILTYLSLMACQAYGSLKDMLSMCHTAYRHALNSDISADWTPPTGYTLTSAILALDKYRDNGIALVELHNDQIKSLLSCQVAFQMPNRMYELAGSHHISEMRDSLQA